MTKGDDQVWFAHTLGKRPEAAKGGSMKIEPTLYRFRDSEQVISAMPGYTPPSGDWEPIYTEAQLRQRLVKALHCWMA